MRLPILPLLALAACSDKPAGDTASPDTQASDDTAESAEDSQDSDTGETAEDTSDSGMDSTDTGDDTGDDSGDDTGDDTGDDSGEDSGDDTDTSSETGPLEGGLDEGDARAVAWGEGAWEYAGSSIAAAGDIDGDGYGDLIVGSPGEEEDSDLGCYDLDLRGRVRIYLGGPALSGELDAYATWLDDRDVCTDTGDRVLGLGDIDGDGLSDVAAASPEHNTVVLLSLLGGGDSSDFLAYLYGEGDYPADGWAAPGDVDGDGLADLLVGEPGATTQEGVVYLISGSTREEEVDLEYVGLTMTGAETDNNLGSNLAAADLDGDGEMDMAVAAEDAEDGRGQVWIGPAGWDDDGNIDDHGWAIDGVVRDARLGFLLAAPGDTDADGYEDLVLGIYKSGGNVAYLLAGPLAEGAAIDDEIATLSGDYSVDLLTISAAGDVDADGYADVVAGDFYGSSADTYGGAGTLFYGPLSGALTTRTADATAFDTEYDARLGWSAQGVGDLDGDGFADIGFGATAQDGSAGTGSGATWLFFGAER